MDLEMATIDEIADELRGRYEAFVLAYSRRAKTSDVHSVFNFQFGGTVGGVHNALGLLEATRATICAENFPARRDPDESV